MLGGDSPYDLGACLARLSVTAWKMMKDRTPARDIQPKMSPIEVHSVVPLPSVTSPTSVEAVPSRLTSSLSDLR